MRLLPVRKCRVLLLVLWLTAAAPATEEPPLSFWRQDTVTGGWNGMRTSLLEQGVSLEAVYTGEMFSNLSGGLRRKAVYLDNVDLMLTIDTERAFGWEGGRFFLYGLGNQGGNPSEHIGDIQIASNIEAPDTWKVFEAWFQQNLFRNRLSLLAGLYDVNSEFAVLKTADLFLNSSFGIGHAFAQSGKNGPSIFPATSLGLRMAAK
ncbi:MAG: carbohydrate porin, partial [Candidatus Binatia bacterium]